MTAADAIQIALLHGCSIGRRSKGLYYVTKGTQEWTIQAKHLREVVKWIEAKFAA